MASNSSRKSGSSDSRKAHNPRKAASRKQSPDSTSQSSRKLGGNPRGRKSVDGSAGKDAKGLRQTTSRRATRVTSADIPYPSATIGELQRAREKAERKQEKVTRRQQESGHAGPARAKMSTMGKMLLAGAILLGILIIAAISVFALSKTDTFRIENLSVKGADHLTEQETSALMDLPKDATLFSIDAEAIKQSLLRDSWVEDVDVVRVFPDTLEVNVTERKVGAIVEVPSASSQTFQNWAISTDGTWLMPIPTRDSEVGSSLAQAIYDDAEECMTIGGIESGVAPEIGAKCTDENVLNALAIASGMTTELAGRVKSVIAADAESTMITLDNNVEIAFGTADNIREKERVCLQILQDNPTTVYINVRVADRPTWRAA